MTDRRDDEHPTTATTVTDFEVAKARVREKAEQAKKHDPLEKARHCLRGYPAQKMLNATKLCSL